jgi:hypothetical protein
MKLRLFLLTIGIETTVIIILLFLIFSQKEFTVIIDDSSSMFSHSVTINNDDLYSEISLTEKGELNSVTVGDKKGRVISVFYSEIGIVSYVILDNETNYRMQTQFPYNFSSDMVLGEYWQNDNEEQEYFVRQEFYKNSNKQYKVNYNKAPYFFDLE